MKKSLFTPPALAMLMMVLLYAISCSKDHRPRIPVENTRAGMPLKQAPQGNPLIDKDFSSLLKEADIFFSEMFQEVTVDQYTQSIETGDMNVIYNAMDLTPDQILHYDTIFTFYANQYLEKSGVQSGGTCSLCDLPEEEFVEVAQMVFSYFQENPTPGFELLVSSGDGPCDLSGYTMCVAACVTIFGEWCPPCAIVCITYCMCEFCPVDFICDRFPTL